MQVETTTFYSSLNRPALIAGVDKQLFFLIVGFSLPMAYSAKFAWGMDFLAVLLFGVLYGIGVIVTKVDYRLLAIYKRHIRYKKYYASIPGIHANVLPVPPSVPVYELKRGLQ